MCTSNGETYPSPHNSVRSCEKFVDLDSDNAKDLLQAGETNLYGYVVVNPNGTAAYVQLFNSATTAAVTLGTTPPDDFIFVPANGATDAFPGMAMGKFPLGLVIASTTTVNGSTDPTTGLIVKILYK